MNKQEYSSLSLTSEFFKILIDRVHAVFKEKHKMDSLPKSSQLYGYGNFNENKPNLKLDLEKLGNDFVNGKYLYDKIREFYTRKPIIKLSNYYKTLILLYIGYKDVQAFIDDYKLSELETEKQLLLIYGDVVDKVYYYLNYYFGEDNTIIKGQTIITNNWKKIKHIYIYRQEDGSVKKHYNFGNIIRREDTIHVHTKTLLDGKLVEGSSETYYIGHNNPANVNFLIGSYSTFDIYTNIVAGRIILEKCSSKEEMIEKSNGENIPSYIAQEIRNQRIVNTNRNVPKNRLELSENSPYSFIYGKIYGTYELTFEFSDGYKETLKFKILSTNYKVIPLTEDVYFENDTINILNKGSVLHLSIDFRGIIALDKVDIYLKTYYLKNNSEEHEGVFSGIDNENRLIKGKVLFNFYR